jgi:two-component system sensor histidine kinase YesM
VSSDINEIDTLSTGVEQMVGEMNTLIKEGTDRQETLRKTELALLQAQINPHFLYNTMDTIMWLIEAGSSEKAVRMVSDLSDFFRHSLSNGKDVVTLGDEEQQITSYLQIQQVRYKDILSFSIDIDDGIKNLNVPKLTLQPLIENALYHGVKEKRGKGKITVTGKEENGTVILSVKDDGAGISEDRLDELKEAFVTGERIGFGLVTVHERLKLFFGDAYNIDVKSKEGEGTEISLMIRRTDDETV